jgi:hypothetical protein
MAEYQPSTNDLYILKNWLFCPMQSDEFDVATFVLEHVNWGLQSNKKGVEWWDNVDSRLCVYGAMQRECAFMLIEVWESHTKKKSFGNFFVCSGRY